MAKLQTALTDAATKSSAKTSTKSPAKTSTVKVDKVPAQKPEVMAVISADTGKTTVVAPMEFSDPVNDGLAPVYTDAGLWSTLKKTGHPKPDKADKVRINFDISEVLYEDIMWAVRYTGHSQREFITNILENFIAIAKRAEGVE
jgi:hypothetical protein